MTEASQANQAQPAASVSAEIAAKSAHVESLFRKNDWDAVSRELADIPQDFGREYVELAKQVSFALGQLHRYDPAIALLERCYAILPEARTASSLAYLYYAKALDQKNGKGNVRKIKASDEQADRDRIKKGFRKWMATALDHEPTSIKDLYRLGVFEAQVEACHDKAALRAFVKGMESYRALDATLKEKRGDLRRAFARCCYAAARSALRLNQLAIARRCSFDGIRADEKDNFVDPLFKLALAGKILLLQGDLEPAERATRKALDGRGPPERKWLHGQMAEIFAQRADLQGAITWLEMYTKPHNRPSYLWRQLGELYEACGNDHEAVNAYNQALANDRMGRHQTLNKIGNTHLKAGRLKEAERAFTDAMDFRKRKYASEDRAAAEGLRQVETAKQARPEGIRPPKLAKHFDRPGVAKTTAEGTAIASNPLPSVAEKG